MGCRCTSLKAALWISRNNPSPRNLFGRAVVRIYISFDHRLLHSAFLYLPALQHNYPFLIPGILVRIDNQVLHKPDRLDHGVCLDVFIDGVDSSGVVANEVSKSINVARQTPVSLCVGIAVRRAISCSEREENVAEKTLPDSQAGHHDQIRVIGVLARAPCALGRTGQEVPRNRIGIRGRDGCRLEPTSPISCSSGKNNASRLTPS